MKLTTKTFLNMGKKDKLNQSLIFHSSIWYLKFQIPLNHNRERIVSLISHFHNNNLNTKAKKKKWSNQMFKMSLANHGQARQQPITSVLSSPSQPIRRREKPRLQPITCQEKSRPQPTCLSRLACFRAINYHILLHCLFYQDVLDKSFIMASIFSLSISINNANLC